MWTKVVNNGHVPCPRAGHSLVLSRDKAVLFGGKAGQYMMNDVYYLLLNELKWIKPKVHGTAGCGRWLHGVCSLKERDALFIIGGINEKGTVLMDCQVVRPIAFYQFVDSVVIHASV